jgi:hypothetical protein
VGFVVDKVALGQVFSEYFCFPANSHSTDCSTLIYMNRGWYSRPVSGRRAEWTQSHPTARKELTTGWLHKDVSGRQWLTQRLVA